jgi:hypothetical protein
MPAHEWWSGEASGPRPDVSIPPGTTRSTRRSAHPTFLSSEARARRGCARLFIWRSGSPADCFFHRAHMPRPPGASHVRRIEGSKRRLMSVPPRLDGEIANEFRT